MKNRRKKLLLFSFVAFLTLLLACAAFLFISPGLYIWPSLTECTVCGGTIWAWERSECRSYPLDVELEGILPEGFAVAVHATSMFHMSCEGVPKGEKVWVEPVQNGGGFKLRKQVLRVKEHLSIWVIDGKGDGGKHP